MITMESMDEKESFIPRAMDFVGGFFISMRVRFMWLGKKLWYPQNHYRCGPLGKNFFRTALSHSIHIEKKKSIWEFIEERICACLKRET